MLRIRRYNNIIQHRPGQHKNPRYHDGVLSGSSEGASPLADVNGDGEINIADINAVIDLILK